MADGVLGAINYNGYKPLLQATISVPSNGTGYIDIGKDLSEYQSIIIVMDPNGNSTRGGGSVYLSSTTTGIDITIGYCYKFGGNNSFSTQGAIIDMKNMGGVLFGQYFYWYNSGSSPTNEVSSLKYPGSIAGKRYLTCKNTSQDGPSTWLVSIYVM